MTGHLLGAAGGIEAIVTVLALQHGILPADDQLRDTPTPSAISTTCRTRRAKAEVDAALSNGFGFGGTNATLAFRRWRD